ncbi:MAG TPA: hypothetical protein VGK72_04430 [Chthoniobacterales bacterium]
MKNKLTVQRLRFALRCARHLFAAAAIFLWVGPSGAAAQPSSVNGGGNGTFNADLDGDGDIDGTHFGFAVVLTPKGAVNGHFTCQMAGNMDFLGLKLMLVEGQVSSAFFAPTSVTFSGTADVTFEPGGVFTDIPFTVIATAGGPGAGTIQLTLIGVFDGVTGDTIPGDNNYSLPVETVLSGNISIK